MAAALHLHQTQHVLPAAPLLHFPHARGYAYNGLAVANT
jgi:hypothetical protein